MPSRATGIGATKRVVVGCVSKPIRGRRADRARLGRRMTVPSHLASATSTTSTIGSMRCGNGSRARIRRLHNGRDRASGGGGTGLAREIVAGVVGGALRPARRERPARRAPAEAEARRARGHHAIADRAVASPFIAALVDDRRDNLSEVERPLPTSTPPGVDVPGGGRERAAAYGSPARFGIVPISPAPSLGALAGDGDGLGRFDSRRARRFGATVIVTRCVGMILSFGDNRAEPPRPTTSRAIGDDDATVTMTLPGRRSIPREIHAKIVPLTEERDASRADVAVARRSRET